MFQIKIEHCILLKDKNNKPQQQQLSQPLQLPFYLEKLQYNGYIGIIRTAIRTAKVIIIIIIIRYGSLNTKSKSQ